MSEISKQEKQEQRRLLAISNTIAEYPPLGLSMYEWQVLVILSSLIDSREKPLLSIDDIKELLDKEGITANSEQNQFLQRLMIEQDTYSMSFDEFFSYYDGNSGLTRKVKKDVMNAIKSLDNRKIVTANTDELYRSFTWFDYIQIDKANKQITFLLGRIAKMVLMGLSSDFLQIMVRSSTALRGKYDIPIFMYMKSHLHKGKKAFAWTEELPKFQQRFGHDLISTYRSDWNNYYRRVLKPCEESSLSSQDISFRFEGKSLGKGKKITHVHCKVWRVGNMYQAARIGASGRKNQEKTAQRTKWKELEAALTLAQKKGYDFLKEKGINHAFLLEGLMTHRCLQHETVVAYEDQFLRLIWARFEKYTKAAKKAGAFVSWWRHGRLTDGDHYWTVIEQLHQVKRKSISDEEQVARSLAATMPYSEYAKAKQKTNAKTETSQVIETSKRTKRVGGEQELLSPKPSMELPTKAPFDYAIFQKKYPTIVVQIESRLFQSYAKLFQIEESRAKMSKANQAKIQKYIKNTLPQHCESWYRVNG